MTKLTPATVGSQPTPPSAPTSAAITNSGVSAAASTGIRTYGDGNADQLTACVQAVQAASSAAGQNNGGARPPGINTIPATSIQSAAVATLPKSIGQPMRARFDTGSTIM